MKLLLGAAPVAEGGSRAGVWLTLGVLLASACGGEAAQNGKTSCLDSCAGLCGTQSDRCGGQLECAPCGGTGGSSSGGAPIIGGASTGGASGGVASGGFGSSDGGTGGIPRPQLPPRPEWEPPEAHGGTAFGSPGWRESNEPVCFALRGVQEWFDVWADERGVFSLVSERPCNVFGGSCGYDNFPGVELQFNDGSGWEVLVTLEPPASRRLFGLPGGPVVLVDYQGIEFFENGQATFQRAGGYESLYDTTFFATGSQRAFSMEGTNLLEYANGAWKSSATNLPQFGQVWADDEALVILSEESIYRRIGAASSFTAVPEVPAGGRAHWAFGKNDIWLGDAVGQLHHFDGSDWTTIHTGTTNPITQLWGSDGVLYFITEREFGRVQAGSAEVLLGPAELLYFWRVWGTSGNEVFIALRDGRYWEYDCAFNFTVWFDGQEFHQF